MYAIIEAGGRQWKVEPGSRLAVNRVSAAVGSRHTVERVLVAHDGQQLQVGRPYLQGASVVCEVLAHGRGPKTVSYHFRRRENWRKTVGHRQPLTRLIVKDILLTSDDPARSAAPAKAGAAARAPRPRATKTETPHQPSAARVRRPRERGDGA